MIISKIKLIEKLMNKVESILKYHMYIVHLLSKIIMKTINNFGISKQHNIVIKKSIYN